MDLLVVERFITHTVETVPGLAIHLSKPSLLIDFGQHDVVMGRIVLHGLPRRKPFLDDLPSFCSVIAVRVTIALVGPIPHLPLLLTCLMAEAIKNETRFPSPSIRMMASSLVEGVTRSSGN